jgi:hypothetical protein
MEQTIVQLIFENWKNLNRLDFDEFMLNQEATLLREEKEHIINAFEDGDSTGDSGSGEFYFIKNFKND